MDSDEVKKAWGNVNKEVSGLGKKLSQHAKDQPEESIEPKKGNAFERFGQAVDKAVGSASRAAKDPDVRDNARQSGQKLADALSTTVTEAVSGAKSAVSSDKPPSGAPQAGPSGAPVPGPSGRPVSGPTGKPVSGPNV